MLMVPKGGLEPPRVTSHAPQTCASTSSATSARSGWISNTQRLHVSLLGRTATGAFGAGVACVLAAADGDGNGACSGTPDCNTELVPVIIGNESIKANSIKAAAAPIVIFDNNVCVPLGPNAVLETELENSAPASDFPGWSRTVTTSTMHARINSP